jgi:hypothetical protein
LVHPTPESNPATAIDRRDWAVVAALVAAWGLMAVVINPVGDFPLNDDFVYALPVQWLVEEGRLGTIYQNAAFFTQMVWGVLWAYLCGFSYTVLRLSTLVAGAVGLGATYLVGRELGLSRALAAVVAGLLATNPVFVSLAYTFMTDVPFLALIMVAFLLLLRGLKYDSGAYHRAGLVTLLALVLLRQVGLALALGLMAAVALKDGLGRAWVIRTLVPTVVLLGVVYGYRKWLEVNDLLPAMYDMYINGVKLFLSHVAQGRLGVVKPTLRAVGFGLLHLGLWLLPLLFLLLPRYRGARTGAVPLMTAAVLGLVAAAVTAALVWAGMGMPVGMPGNILVDLGTGLPSLEGPAPHAPRGFWVAVTWASAFGAACILLAIGQMVRPALARLGSAQGRRSLWLSALLLVSLGVVYAPFCIMYGPWFDRYLLPVMALLALLLARNPVAMDPPVRLQPSLGPRVLVAAALALVYLGFTVVSTHDYLAWNRARWAAAAPLIARGIAPDDIRGGYEFDQYHAWRPLPEHVTNASRAAFADRPNRAKEHAHYVLAFGDEPGYDRVRRIAVNRWFPLSPGQVVVLKRPDAGSAPGRGSVP